MDNSNKKGLQSISLLDRLPPEGYSEECLASVQKPIAEEFQDGVSTLIFRILNEWLAFPTMTVKEVREEGRIHKLPHRATAILEGITNVQGELKIVISLRNLLKLSSEIPDEISMSHRIYARFIVFGKGKDDFVFPVEEVFGIMQLKPSMLETAPVTVSKSFSTFTRGVFNFQQHRIGLLDASRILNHLKEHHL